MHLRRRRGTNEEEQDAVRVTAEEEGGEDIKEEEKVQVSTRELQAKIQIQIQIQDPFKEEKVTVQVSGSEDAAVPLALRVSRSVADQVQPERPLETRAESLPCAHPPQK